MISVNSGPKVDAARNDIFKVWLTETDASHMLMVDTDMVLPVDVLDRLLACNKDIASALCFTTGFNGNRVIPAIRVIVESSDGSPTLQPLWDYPVNTLIQVDAIGAACFLVKRKVAEGIWEARGRDHAMPWFAHGMHNGVVIGEDVAFCLTAGKCGFEVWVDTGLVVDHVKPHLYGELDYVFSLSGEGHPHYTERDEVPIYRKLTGNGSFGEEPR